MPDAGGQWPASNELLIPEAERAKTVFDAQVDTVTCAVKAQQDATVKQDQAMTVMYNAWSTANRDADASNLAKFHDTMTTLAIGSVDRARAGAELVQKASAALVTLYTGVLALVFSVTNNPLPPRGVLAPVFLGLAVVLSTAYIAYLEPTTGYNPAPTPVLGPEPKALERLNTIITTAGDIATRRSVFLRASVVALGFGLAYIVLPFITFSTGTTPPANAAGTAAAWPTPTAGVPLELNKILYDAQVKEAAAARAVTTAPSRTTTCQCSWGPSCSAAHPSSSSRASPSTPPPPGDPGARRAPNRPVLSPCQPGSSAA